MCLLFLTIPWIRHSDETQQEWLISASHSICWGWNSQDGLFMHTYDSSASVVWTAGSWLRQLNWSDMSGCRFLLLAGFLYYSPCSISFIPQHYPSTATSKLVFPWGVSSSGVPWLLEWQKAPRKREQKQKFSKLAQHQTFPSRNVQTSTKFSFLYEST